MMSLQLSNLALLCNIFQAERQPVPKVETVETVETEQPEGQQTSPAPDTGVVSLHMYLCLVQTV